MIYEPSIGKKTLFWHAQISVHRPETMPQLTVDDNQTPVNNGKKRVNLLSTNVSSLSAHIGLRVVEISADFFFCYHYHREMEVGPSVGESVWNTWRGEWGGSETSPLVPSP